uniref:Uncharacterized protein LOC111109835 n=1 Tax=Crassostrea virginica TaxID=6565 RepID=A0A8B8BEJ1_CRAVI|nr:uncharacterized protein LOC111109835 [Crassostrea virginica]
MSALLSFTRFTDYGSYFSLPLPFSVYFGIAVAALGIVLCIFAGLVKSIRRCTRGEMKMTGDEFSSTRQIIDVELNYAQSTKHRQKAHLSVIDAGIQDEVSSHGYADIDELNSDDYVNVKEELNNSDDDDEFDYENLRDGV